jgi:nucleotide-binding universal stress UspA family protein
MKWIVGLDLRHRSHGALQFARWLSRLSPSDRFEALHVLEPEHLRAALRTHHLDEVVAAARTEAQRIAAEEAPGARLDGVEVVSRDADADVALAEEARARRAEAMVVGRVARREQARLVRLGSVARRLLRALPLPVVVAPPDLDEAQIGAGPVVALTSLSDDAVAACRFAEAFAARVRRPLLVAHVVKFVELSYLTGASVEDAAREEVRAGEAALAAWMKDRSIRADASVVLQGEIVDRVDVLARERACPLVVVGSKRRGGIDALTHPSIGRELAATSTVPVAVVPTA